MNIGIAALVLSTAMGTPLSDLREMLQPEYQDVASLGADAEALYQRIQSPTGGTDGLRAAEAFTTSENLPRSMYAYALAKIAAEQIGNNRPNQAIETLRRIAHEFADVPEVAMLAELEIGRLMADSGGASDAFDPTIVEMQDVYEPIFENYSPYGHRIVEGHLKFAEECSEAAQQPIYSGFADLAVRHAERAIAIMDEVDANPSLVPIEQQRRLISNFRAVAKRRLGVFIERRTQRQIEEEDPFPLMVQPSDDVPEPTSCQREALRSIVSAGKFIDSAMARSIATHCSSTTLAVLGDYLRPNFSIPARTNALHILSLVPDGLTVSWAFEEVTRKEIDPDLREAIAEHINPYNFIERIMYYGGREDNFARLYGLDAVPAIRRGLDWEAPPRAQRNAAYFAQAIPHDGVRMSLRERLRNLPAHIADAGDHPLGDTFGALGKIGLPGDLALLAGMATVAYWEKYSIPIWEPYERENRPIVESRDRWRNKAINGLKASELTEAKEHLRRLERTDAKDLFQ